MNYSSLYPVVHDLPDVDESYGCCSMALAPPGCFSLHDLVNPVMAYGDEEEPAYQNSPRCTPFRTRQRSEYPTSQQHLRSLIDDDRNDSASIVADRKLQFDEIYVLTRQVYKGRLSSVWECVHRETGIRYAAKIVNKRNMSSKDEDLVYQEMSVLAEIKGECQHLSNLLGFFDEDTRFYIVLDYAEGGDMLTTLVQKGKLNEMEAKLLAKVLLEGLVHLHKMNVCHRNLKPENIVLKKKQDMSTAVIVDFGMAARVLQDSDGDALNLTERCGTAMFMAPEVIAQIPYDTQADMWSFGVFMFFVLSGVQPFEDNQRHALYLKICKNEYSFHTMDWKGVSKNAKRFVSHLLHADPEVRMTAAECLLHPWLDEFLPPTPPSEPVEIPSETLARPPAQTKVKSQGRRLNVVWRAMTKRRSAFDEVENMDDWKSTTTKTASLLSSRR